MFLEKTEKKDTFLRRNRRLSILISFLGGALLLSFFSICQKLVVHEGALIFNPHSYIMPILYGGMTGMLLGLWYTRLKENEAKLLAAYHSTLEGWAKAGEMRDKNTQEHSNRVVVLTEKLARAMKIKEYNLVHILRGALLHDIGKLGIPDSILNKPGSLTEEERAVMQKHTIHASDMLSNIEFLLPAIPIPCCHHERWDGSGYPDGLKGEEIPLEARIFTIVDVWDALTSDRPYRKAWKKEDALAHIEENAGILFDPQVVEAFILHIHPFLSKENVGKI